MSCNELLYSTCITVLGVQIINVVLCVCMCLCTWYCTVCYYCTNWVDSLMTNIYILALFGGIDSPPIHQRESLPVSTVGWAKTNLKTNYHREWRRKLIDDNVRKKFKKTDETTQPSFSCSVCVCLYVSVCVYSYPYIKLVHCDTSVDVQEHNWQCIDVHNFHRSFNPKIMRYLRHQIDCTKMLTRVL